MLPQLPFGSILAVTAKHAIGLQGPAPIEGQRGSQLSLLRRIQPYCLAWLKPLELRGYAPAAGRDSTLKSHIQ